MFTDADYRDAAWDQLVQRLHDAWRHPTLQPWQPRRWRLQGLIVADDRPFRQELQLKLRSAGIGLTTCHAGGYGDCPARRSNPSLLVVRDLPPEPVWLADISRRLSAAQLGILISDDLNTSPLAGMVGADRRLWVVPTSETVDDLAIRITRFCDG